MMEEAIQDVVQEARLRGHQLEWLLNALREEWARQCEDEARRARSTRKANIISEG